MNNTTALFAVICVSLYLTGCGGDRDFEYCRDHFDFAAWISLESDRVQSEEVRAVKVISTSDGNSADSIPMTARDLEEVFSGMTEFNIDLPNLIGRYSCTDTTSVDSTTQTEFKAEDDRLSVRVFHLTKDGSGEVLQAGGYREVGSVLASMHKEFLWDAGERILRIKIDYSSMLGADKSYRIVFLY